MSEAFYILFSVTVLSLTGWLDDMLSKLQISKVPFIIIAALMLIICSYKTEIYCIAFSPASFILFAVPLAFALVSRKTSIFAWFAVSSVMLIFLYAALFILPSADIVVLMIALGGVCAALPFSGLFALSVCTTVPFLTYLLSLFGDYFFYMANNAPSCETVFLSQLASAVTALSVWYAKTAVISYRKQHATRP